MTEDQAKDADQDLKDLVADIMELPSVKGLAKYVERGATNPTQAQDLMTQAVTDIARMFLENDETATAGAGSAGGNTPPEGTPQH